MQLKESNMEKKENTGMSLDGANGIAKRAWHDAGNAPFNYSKSVFEAMKLYAHASQPIKPKMSLQECKDQVAKRYDNGLYDFNQQIIKSSDSRSFGFINQLLDEVAELYASKPINSGWVSVETLPEEDGIYIVYNAKIETIAIFEFHKKFGCFLDVNITHYMPLPEAPPKQ